MEILPSPPSPPSMLIPFESSELPLRGYIIAIMDSSLSLNRQSVLAPTVGITVCFANWRRYSAPLLQPGDQVPQPQARGCDTGVRVLLRCHSGNCTFPFPQAFTPRRTEPTQQGQFLQGDRPHARHLWYLPLFSCCSPNDIADLLHHTHHPHEPDGSPRQRPRLVRKALRSTPADPPGTSAASGAAPSPAPFRMTCTAYGAPPSMTCFSKRAIETLGPVL